MANSSTDECVTYRGTVYPWQCDHMGHMNVMHYVARFDEACWQLLAMCGLSASRFQRDGTAVAAVEQHLEYKRELHAGDVITVRSAVLQVNDKSVRIAHEMRDDDTGEIAATCVVVGVYLDAATRKARPLAMDVRGRAALMMRSPQQRQSGREAGPEHPPLRSPDPPSQRAVVTPPENGLLTPF